MFYLSQLLHLELIHIVHQSFHKEFQDFHSLPKYKFFLQSFHQPYIPLRYTLYQQGSRKEAVQHP